MILTLLFYDLQPPSIKTLFEHPSNFLDAICKTIYTSAILLWLKIIL